MIYGVNAFLVPLFEVATECSAVAAPYTGVKCCTRCNSCAHVQFNLYNAMIKEERERGRTNDMEEEAVKMDKKTKRNMQLIIMHVVEFSKMQTHLCAHE